MSSIKIALIYHTAQCSNYHYTCVNLCHTKCLQFCVYYNIIMMLNCKDYGYKTLKKLDLCDLKRQDER